MGELASTDGRSRSAAVRERLEIELERARQTGDLISLVIFDIDHFKHYNDTNGHSEGNVVLVQVSAILKNAGRRGDIPARYGGEELVALLYGATREEAARFAEHVRQDVEAYAFKGGSTQPLGKVTVSAGVATYPWDATGDATLIKAADQNLYKAKEGGATASSPTRRSRREARAPVRVAAGVCANPAGR